MEYDIIYSGRFYFRGSYRDLEVGVKDGVIRGIGKAMTGGPRKTLEGAILPAGTDIHVHFRDPGETDKEDFITGSTAALFGGTTTVYDMPNNRIPVNNYSVFDDKLSIVKSKSFCDFGLYSLYDGRNADVISRKSSGIKIFLGGSTNAIPVGDIPHADLEKINALQVPVVFHGEDSACLSRHFIQEEHDLKEHDLARPEECELESAKVISNLPLDRKIMAHVSSPGTVASLAENVKKEVTPHHLLLNNAMNLGSWGKVNPPLRKPESQDALMRQFREGRFDVLSTDHAPHTEHDKEEFYQASSGIPGVETRLPLMLYLVSAKIIDLDLLIRTASENPASIMGIKKGKIEPGFFADFIAVKFSDIRRINQDRLHSKSPISPFHGFNAVFPITVIMRGETVIDKYELVEDRRGIFTGDLETVER